MQKILAWRRCGFLNLACLIAALPGIAGQQSKPFNVHIVQEKAQFGEGSLAVDPKVRIDYQYNGNMTFGVSAEGRRLTANADSVSTSFLIDGMVKSPMVGKKLQDLPEELPGMRRHGGQTMWEQDGVRISMTLEAIASKPKSAVSRTRRLDTLLCKYSIENLSEVVHKVACRTVVDTIVHNGDITLFAAPTAHPDQVLNGVLLQNKGVPEFIEVLERPDLSDPGFKGIFTFKFDKNLEGPGRVVLTSSTAAHRDKWAVAAERTRNRSACALFWEQRDLPPQARRDLAFAYGQGIAVSNEGRVSVDFRGSFEPGRHFTITAYVDSPMPGQSLTLQLPAGIERTDGAATQIVPRADETGRSVMMWQCRLAQVGTYSVSFRSNTGVTQTWTVTVSAN